MARKSKHSEISSKKRGCSSGGGSCGTSDLYNNCFVKYIRLKMCSPVKSDNPNKWLRNQNTPKLAVKSVAAQPGSVYHYQSPSSAAAEGHVEL